MRLAKTDLISVLNELAGVFPSKDRGTGITLADAYHGALEDLSAAEVRAAAQVVVRQDRFFPRPSRLREIALQNRSKQAGGPHVGSYAHWWLYGMPEGQPCPVCGSVLGDLPSGRLGVVHDHRQHMDAQVPYAGPRAA